MRTIVIETSESDWKMLREAIAAFRPRHENRAAYASLLHWINEINSALKGVKEAERLGEI